MAGRIGAATRSGGDAAASPRARDAAKGHADAHLAAVRATSILLAAVHRAGWRTADVAAVVGMTPAGVRLRIAKGRSVVGERAGLDLPVAPPRPGRRGPPLPIEQRESLTCKQAAAASGITKSTLSQWYHAGLLPRTRSDVSPRLYARSDLDRIAAAPRLGNAGISGQQPAP